MGKKNQGGALNHVNSNRKKSGESSKNLTQNRSLSGGKNGVRHEDKTETDG
jgi:hypothetical protein